MEEELLEAFPEAAVELIPSSGGIFDVTKDGTLIFSKKGKIATDTERFPEIGEIVKLAQPT